MTERLTHHDLRNKLIQSKADGMSYRWLPVQRKDADKTPLGVTLSRSFVEEIGFFPSKVATLMGVFNTKDAVQPGFLTWFYMNMVKIVFFTPWLLAQAILWQGWRTIKALYRVTTGSLTYLDKEKVLPKNK